ncbi:hypothetical protein B0H13DRAFT_2380663 [Mycena leptocephala]|nr:hypothetical protein B0H13DRAFT_2380663 [Mycena leptocephala]
MSSAVLPGLKVVDEGNNGFVIGTPEDWKALLSAGAPAEVLVSHANGHADSLATELLNGNNQHWQHPLTVVAQTVPCFKTIYDETPFMNADGTYTDVWMMCGNHCVGGLQLYATESKDPNAAWLCDIYHPCFLKIHDEHQRHLILIDNIASDDEMLKKPGSLRATILHALDVVIEFWRKFHLIPTEAPPPCPFQGFHQLNGQAQTLEVGWAYPVAGPPPRKRASLSSLGTWMAQWGLTHTFLPPLLTLTSISIGFGSPQF